MPLEIKEIVINASLTEKVNNGIVDEVKTAESPTDKAEIIAECVEQVLEILREKMQP